MSSFKPGDWVKYKDQQDTTIYKVINILSNDLIDIEDTIVDKYDIELWQPKLGEWCWFWNQSDINLSISPHIGQYGNLSYSLEFYDNCEPFIGQLPTHLKDQS